MSPFSRKVEIASISWYMLTTLGYVTALYIPLSILLNKIAGGETAFYHLLIGLLITLLLSFILISLAYAQDIYNLYKLSIKDAEITIERSFWICISSITLSELNNMKNPPTTIGHPLFAGDHSLGN